MCGRFASTFDSQSTSFLFRCKSILTSKLGKKSELTRGFCNCVLKQRALTFIVDACGEARALRSRILPQIAATQSCAVTKSEDFWLATGQSNSGRQTARHSKIFQVSLHTQTTALSHTRGIVSCGPPEVFTFIYCAWLWNFSSLPHDSRRTMGTWERVEEQPAGPAKITYKRTEPQKNCIFTDAK